MGEQQPARTKRRNPLRSFFFNAPFNIPTYIMRGLYGFRVEGEENIPEEGPYIVLYAEPGMLGLLLSGHLAIKVLRRVMVEDEFNNMSLYHEELFRVGFFNRATSKSGQYRPLVPHSAPQMARGLLDAYRVLMNKGVIQTNPSGDAPWDGRPVPFGRAVAWLALRTAAPIVLMLTPVGGYEIWPRWQRLPSLRGRMKITIPKPFKLCEEPLEGVTDQDIAEANALLMEHWARAHYGPKGLEGWIGPVLRNGAPVTEPIELRPPDSFGPLAEIPAASARPKPSGRGVVQLLWQCPVCRTNEGLVHRRPLIGSEAVACQACGTRWAFQRVAGQDFRMKVVEGPPDLVGLDMPLSTWYEQMKANFAPRPIEMAGVDLWPGEEVYLESQGVALAPYRPNPLFDGALRAGREPPNTQTDWLQIAGWDSIGEGRVVVTNQRLLWQGEQGELDFLWREVTAVSHYPIHTLALHYGSAKYRFDLSRELIQLWLHHAGELAKAAGALEGRTVMVSHH